MCNKINNKIFFLLGLFFLWLLPAAAQELYDMPEKEVQTRWSSFENPTAGKGLSASENKGAKGHPFDKIPAQETVTLLDVQGSGTVRRIWMTINERTPKMLRSLTLNMYWDGNEKPAVSVPLGDFFGIGLGKKVAFESSLFADPEGRSFLSFVPMPFKTAAKITITNNSDKDLGALFYDVNITMGAHDEDMLYFHAFWNRDLKTTLGEDFVILPKIEGKGRFLGMNMGINTNDVYEDSWFGEGEVKMYMDGDGELPTLAGTGIEDYVGTAYGQGEYSQDYQGSLIAKPKEGEFAFYRYHIPDPVYFYDDLKVTVQQIGGAPQDVVREFIENDVPLTPITIDNNKEGFIKLLEDDASVDFYGENVPEGWTNFFRQDDVSSTAYFYLDAPTTNLPPLQTLEIRTKNLE